MVFEVYDAERQKSRCIPYVDATDYDQLHFLYDESEAARVRQMRTIEELTRERDALAAECGEWRSYNFGSGDITKVDAAIEATNALPGMRERLEGQG